MKDPVVHFKTEYNILLVVVDDLRVDLKSYGYHRNTMPLLEKRLSTATVFQNCHSPVGWTLPACASIVTGLNPDQHGLYDHYQKFKHPKIGHYLGERYYKIGITNNGNMVSDQISETYLERIGHLRRPEVWNYFGWDTDFDIYNWTHREDHQKPFSQAIDFLKNPGSQPYFMFFHTNIVHDYDLDRPYYKNVREWLGEDLHSELHGFRDGTLIWRTPPQGMDQAYLKRHIKGKYDSGLRYADTKLDEIFNLVNFDDTIVVLVSDHGEGFEPEHGRVHHTGRLHSDLTHVPLVVWLPTELKNRYKPKPTETRVCSTIDIVPTLLNILDKNINEFPGHVLFDLPPHRELNGFDRGYIFWEEDCVRESYKQHSIEIRSTLRFPLKTISTRKNKDQKEAAYNLAYDPGEYSNLLHTNGQFIQNFEPISFVITGENPDELHHNLLASPVSKSPHHEWIFLETQDHAICSRQLNHAWNNAEHDLVFFIHHNVYLPLGWEAKAFLVLAELEKRDPNWGVLGAVGAVSPEPIRPKVMSGHWCDINGYSRFGIFPQEVQTLSEWWFGVRKSSELRFNPGIIGSQNCALDISKTGREKGMRSYVIDAFIWHDYRNADGGFACTDVEKDRISSPEIRLETE